MKEKIHIDPIYRVGEELRINKTHWYEAYADVISSILPFDLASSFCDVGAATGGLMFSVKKRYPNIKVKGYEYFSYHKTNAPELIRDDLEILDLRDPIPNPDKYDIVNCTEVGEHIESEYSQKLIDNIKSLSKKYVITTWANGRKRGQHLNPLSREEYVKLLTKNGLHYDVTLTSKLVNKCKVYRDIINVSREKLESSEVFARPFIGGQNPFKWWTKSLVVWTMLAVN